MTTAQSVQLANPFQTAPVAARPTNALAEVESQRAIAEVQAAIILAKKFPRDKVRSTEEILNDCCRESLAAVAVYSYARGGSEITGPSIRLAEAIAQNWGNLQFGWNELSRSNGASEVEAWAWDTEKNLRRSIKFQVKHVRNTKRGSYALEDERDIYELCANQAARRLRACILNLIPGDVVEAAVKQCDATLNSKVQVTPERIANMVKAFEQFGVTKDQMEKRVQRRLDTINGPQMVSLTKIYNSLKDGMSKAADWFDPITDGKESDEKPATRTDAVKDKLKTRKAAAAQSEPQPEEQTTLLDAGASDGDDLSDVPAFMRDQASE